MNKIILKVVGGFGNQLFMVFNAISLAIDYKLNLIIDTNQYDSNRPSIDSYKLFNSKNLNKEKITDFSNLKIIKQNNFYYSKIILESQNNYLINNDLYDYYQSYKFFWHNIEDIKSYLNIDFDKINNYKSILNSIGNHIAIHIRLTDYIKHSDFHKVVDIDYYKNIISLLNLTNYKIILFSDDIESAKNMLLTFINSENIILANQYTSTDEEQLYFLACTDIRICANSSYSLWSCYLNEMYQFNNNSMYYFPSKWFGPHGYINYNINDLIPDNNSKYKIINV